jgi:hypothetical protein
MGETKSSLLYFEVYVPDSYRITLQYMNTECNELISYNQTRKLSDEETAYVMNTAEEKCKKINDGFILIPILNQEIDKYNEEYEE